MWCIWDVTCCEITGWLIGSLPDNRSVSDEQILLSFPHPSNTFGCALSDRACRSHSVPYLSMCLVLTCLESLIGTWGLDHCNLISGSNDVFKVMDGLLGIFHCEKGGQVRSVCWYGDENAEPITSRENATWNKFKWPNSANLVLSEQKSPEN